MEDSLSHLDDLLIRTVFENRRNLTQIKIQTFADAKLFGRRHYREKNCL